jgi:aspartate kinase
MNRGETKLQPVFKFGGTSMGSLERIEHVASLCAKLKPSAIVVSAMSGETNRLVGMAKQILNRTDVPEYDMLVASGEQVSVALLSLALRKIGIEPVPMLAPNAGILTDTQFSRASILKINKDMISHHIKLGKLPVIAGFQGVTEDGQLTSLGRGGSDTSAVAIAAAIGAKDCVIYTDVDGVFTTDPRVCPQAKIINKINYEEMLEMASQGSKVLHIRSVQLAAKWNINLFVKNTFSTSEGTQMLTQETPLEGEVVTGIATTQDECWIQIGPYQHPDFNLAFVFTLLADKGVNVDIINQNEEQNSLKLSFTVTQTDETLARETLQEKFESLTIHSRCDVSKISIVGVGMRTHAGVAARMFRTLAKEKIGIFLVTTSEIKVGCLVLRENMNKAVNILHKEFIR